MDAGEPDDTNYPPFSFQRDDEGAGSIKEEANAPVKRYGAVQVTEAGAVPEGHHDMAPTVGLRAGLKL
ncbi:hypothetical protein E4U33_006406 [Claviceps sp. LM78 group G4]|nr:hypothetical protein E4U33_006406 [Claviceps sp. LM78 group G4]